MSCRRLCSKSKPILWNGIFVIVLLFMLSLNPPKHLYKYNYQNEDTTNRMKMGKQYEDVKVEFDEQFRDSKTKFEEQLKDIKSALIDLRPGLESQHLSGKEPTVWLHIANIYSENMELFKAVFDTLGYKQGSQFSDWDVLWTISSPFRELGRALKNISVHQKINHIPGLDHVANKKLLSTSYNIKGIPKSFVLPEDKSSFEAYAKDHPDYKWLKKGNNHRNIKIVSTQQGIIFEGDAGKVFLQRFIENPLLIDGRMFDFGIYVAVTSIDPLRVYVHDVNWLSRFCRDKYHPFDPTHLPKYVIADDFIPVWEMPAMQKLYKMTGDSRKEPLMSYLRSQGINVTKVAQDSYDILKEVFLQANNKILQNLQAKFGGKNRNFFEVIRCDFIMDEKINVYLMECNSNPNFSSHVSYATGNRVEFSQTIYSFLTLVGIGRNTKVDYLRSSNESRRMMASEKNIHVFSDICASSKCENNCKDIYCSLCPGCYSKDFALDLKYTVLEHNHRGDWRRIIPRVFKDANEAKNWDPLKDPYYSSKSEKNKLMSFWIKGKCIKNDGWCI